VETVQKCIKELKEIAATVDNEKAQSTEKNAQQFKSLIERLEKIVEDSGKKNSPTSFLSTKDRENSVIPLINEAYSLINKNSISYMTGAIAEYYYMYLLSLFYEGG
jgi:hypothetical protein